jgi:ADP-ribose pyrophosphatase YjhB (NUDIX family)
MFRKHFYAGFEPYLRPVWPLVRAALHRWFLLSRGLTLGVRAAVIDGQDRVLLVRHSFGGGGWQLPGGGVEVGETALEALGRELREEAAVVVTGPPLLHGVFHQTLVSRRDHVLVYAVREFRVLGPKAPDGEIAEAAFFPLANLPESTTRGTRARLAEIAAGSPAPGAVW